MSSNFGSNLFPIAAAVVIIVIAIGVSAAVQDSTDKSMSQVLTVGPVWNTDSWTCTSDSDFVVHAMIRGVGSDPLPLIKIWVENQGTQSFYNMPNSEPVSFSIGNQADTSIIITRTGTVTGFLTLQTTSDAIASCIEV